MSPGPYAVPPRNADEYQERFNLNQRFSGFGLDAKVHLPCPFCAAPDFVIYKIIEVEAAMGQGALCKECGRGAKALYQRGAGSLAFEIVQTCGPVQPDWLVPQMRRLQLA